MSLSDTEILQINQALFSLAHAYEARMGRENPPAKTGMTLYDCAVLMVIGQCAPIQSRELARKMDVTPSTVSTYVQRLLQKGLIQKECDRQDRRIWWINLTGMGRFAYREIISGTVRYTRDFLDVLSEDERRDLHTILHKLAHALGHTWQ